MSTDVSTEIPRTRGRRRLVLAVAGGTHAIHDGYGGVLYVLLPLWAQELGLNLTQVGLLKAIFSGVIAVFQLPAGLLAERFGERGLLALGTAGLGLGFLLFGIADGFATLALALAFTGVCSATQHPLASALVSDAFRARRRRGALGTYNFAGDVGKAAFPAALAALAGVAGWRTGSNALGVLGITVAVAIHLALRRLDVGGLRAGSTTRDRPASTAAGSGGWGIRDRRGFVALAAMGVLDSAGRGAFLTFFPFLLVAKGADVAMLGFAVTLVAAGGAAGKLACGVLGDRWGILRTVIATEAATAVGTAALIVVPLPVSVVLLPFLGAALNGTSSVLYGTVGDLVDRDREVRALGLFYGLVFAASAVAPLASGIASDAVGLTVTIGAIAGLFLLPIPLCLPLAASLPPTPARQI